MKTVGKRDDSKPKSYYDDYSGVHPPQNVDVYTDETRPIICDAEGRPLRRVIGFRKIDR